MTKTRIDNNISEVEDLYEKPIISDGNVLFGVYCEIEIVDGKMTHSCAGYHHPTDFSDFLICLNNLYRPLSKEDFSNFKEIVTNFTIERMNKDKNLTIPQIENFVKNCRSTRDIIISNYEKEEAKANKVNEIINELL